MKKGIVVLLGVVGIATVSGVVFGIVFSEYLPWNARWGGLVRIEAAEDSPEGLRVVGGVVELTAPIPGKAEVFAGHVRALSDIEGDLTAGGVVVEVTGNVSGKTRIAGGVAYLSGVFEDTVKVTAASVVVSGQFKGPVILNSPAVTIEDDAEMESEQVMGTEVRRDFKSWLLLTVIGLLFFLGIGIVMSLGFSWHLIKTTDIFIESVGKATLVGVLGLLAFPILLTIGILLALTVIGATAGGILVVPYVMCALLCFIYVGTTLGRFLLKKINKGKEPHLVVSMLAGVSFTVLLCRIPYAGVFIYLVVLILGFGAFITRRIEIITWNRAQKETQIDSK